MKKISYTFGNAWVIFVLRGDRYKAIPRTKENILHNFNRLHIDDMHNLNRIFTDVRILETYNSK